MKRDNGLVFDVFFLLSINLADCSFMTVLFLEFSFQRFIVLFIVGKMREITVVLFSKLSGKNCQRNVKIQHRNSNQRTSKKLAKNRQKQGSSVRDLCQFCLFNQNNGGQQGNKHKENNHVFRRMWSFSLESKIVESFRTIQNNEESFGIFQKNTME